MQGEDHSCLIKKIRSSGQRRSWRVTHPPARGPRWDGVSPSLQPSSTPQPVLPSPGPLGRMRTRGGLAWLLPGLHLFIVLAPWPSSGDIVTGVNLELDVKGPRWTVRTRLPCFPGSGHAGLSLLPERTRATFLCLGDSGPSIPFAGRFFPPTFVWAALQRGPSRLSWLSHCPPPVVSSLHCLPLFFFLRDRETSVCCSAY